MPLKRFRRVLIASALAALVAPAAAQSFHHAPPTPPGEDALLPIITPGRFSRQSPPAPKPQRPPQPSSAGNWSRPGVGGAATQQQVRHAVAPAKPTGVASNAPVLDNGKKDESPAMHARTLAAQALAKGDYQTAEKLLAEAVERLPNDVATVVSLAQVRESQQNWLGAIAAYDIAVRLEPAQPEWLARRADCRFHAGQFLDGILDYTAAEKAGVKLTAAQYARLGDAALRMGDHATAEKAFESLGQLEGEQRPQVELLRAIAALRQGKTEAARGILLQASAKWPRDAALTEALRVAAKIHYGDVESVATAAATATDGREPIVETSGTKTAPVVSRWRKTSAAAPTTAEPQENAPSETEEAKPAPNTSPSTESADLPTAEAVDKTSEATDAGDAGEPSPFPATDEEPRLLP